MQKLQKAFGATLTIALLAIFITGCAETTPAVSTTPPSTSPSPNPSATPTPTPVPTPAPTPTTPSTKYTNGSYTAVGEYVTPGGVEDLNVSVTLKNDLISAASFTGTPDGPITTRMQANFKSGFKELVVGKALDKVNLTVVNGSSLTPNGFMDALAKIKAKAKA